MRIGLNRYSNADVGSHSALNFDLMAYADNWTNSAVMFDYGGFSTGTLFSNNLVVRCNHKLTAQRMWGKHFEFAKC